MNSSEAQRQLAAPPAPNPMGQDAMRITERHYLPSMYPGRPPVLVRVVEGPIEIF